MTSILFCVEIKKNYGMQYLIDLFVKLLYMLYFISPEFASDIRIDF